MRKFDLVISETPRKPDGSPVLNRQNQQIRRWHKVGTAVETDKGGIRLELPPGITIEAIPGSPIYLFPQRSSGATNAQAEDDDNAPF